MTTDIRRTAAAPPAWLLPLVLVGSLLGVAILMAQIAPSRATGAVYQIIIVEDSSRLVIPPESLTCAATRCAAQVAGRTLEVDARDIGFQFSCEARHGDRSVRCSAQYADSGHASPSVLIVEPLGLTEAERASLRAAVPWWRSDDGPSNVALLLVGTLTVVAALSTSLVQRRSRPVPASSRKRLTIGVAAIAWAQFALSSVLLSENPAFAWILVLVLPYFWTSVALVAAWQWRLSGATLRAVQRIPLTLGAALAVAVYSGVSVFWFLLCSGFID